MDNNSNFEQQFTQNLNAGAATMQPIETSTGSSKLPLIVAIALAAITLVESIVLIITLSNYFSLVNDDGYYEDEPIVNEDATIDNDYKYDENNTLVALKATCVANNGSTYTLDLSNNYKLSGGDSAAASGTYSITNDSLVSLSGSNKVLYYDGITIADGLTIYYCEGNTESDVE